MRRALVSSFVLITVLLTLPATDPVAAQDAAPPETTTVVTTEAQYRDAVVALSADDSGPHLIRIGADFELEESDTAITYTGTQPLAIDGQGHTVRGQGSRSSTGMLLDQSHLLLTVEDLTLRNLGAGVRGSSSMVIRRSNFSGIGSGAVSAFGSAPRSLVIVSGSTFRGNRSYSGGAVSSSGRIIATTSTFVGNRARQDGAALYARAELRVERSTIAGNSSRAGSAISSQDGDVTLENTTVSGNRNYAVNGGNGHGTVHSGDRITLDHATIAGNRNDSSFAGSDVALSGDDLVSRSSVVQHPRRDCAFDSGTTSKGSRSSDPSCDFNGPNHGVLADARLGALTDNGGPTLTQRPLADSPLIDAVACRPAVPLDQRGVRRPQGPRCDIGAVEVFRG